MLSFISPSLQNATNWGIRLTSLYLHHRWRDVEIFRSQYVFEVEKYQKRYLAFKPTKESTTTSILLFLSFLFKRRGQCLNFVSLRWTNLWQSTCFTCKCHFTLKRVKVYKNRSSVFAPKIVKKIKKLIKSRCFIKALGESGSS